MTNHGSRNAQAANVGTNVESASATLHDPGKTVESVRLRFDPQHYDPWYFSHSIGHEMCIALDAIPEQIRDFKRLPHPLSGIEVHCREFHVKVWKVSGDEMPIAG